MWCLLLSFYSNYLLLGLPLTTIRRKQFEWFKMCETNEQPSDRELEMFIPHFTIPFHFHGARSKSMILIDSNNLNMPFENVMIAKLN